MANRPSTAEQFALEYVKDLNATAAYLRLKPHVKRTTAGVEGFRLLKNPKTQEAIANVRGPAIERLRVDAQKIKDELAILGFSDLRHYLRSDTEHFELKPGLDDEAGRAVSKVKHRTIYKGDQVEHHTEIETHNKLGALNTLAKIEGLIDKEKNQGATLTMTWRYVDE